MNKTNDSTYSARMKVSMGKPATTHSHTDTSSAK